MTMLHTVNAPIKTKSRATIVAEIVKAIKDKEEFSPQELASMYRTIFGGKCKATKDGKMFQTQGLPHLVKKAPDPDADAITE